LPIHFVLYQLHEYSGLHAAQKYSILIERERERERERRERGRGERERRERGIESVLARVHVSPTFIFSLGKYKNSFSQFEVVLSQYIAMLNVKCTYSGATNFRKLLVQRSFTMLARLTSVTCCCKCIEFPTVRSDPASPPGNSVVAF